jgi:hypothetical protein
MRLECAVKTLARVSALGLCYAACHSAARPSDSHNQAFSDSPMAVPDGHPATSSGLAEAKRLADEVIAIVRTDSEAGLVVLKDRARPVLAKLEELSLESSEVAELRTYVESGAADILPAMRSWSPKTTEVSVVGGSATPAPPGSCLVRCEMILMYDCATNVQVGVCFGIWGCEQGAVVECDVEPDNECKEQEDCPPGYDCANWVFKENECLKICRDDDDCQRRQRCKKPLGASFRFCD